MRGPDGRPESGRSLLHPAHESGDGKAALVKQGHKGSAFQGKMAFDYAEGR